MDPDFQLETLRFMRKIADSSLLSDLTLRDLFAALALTGLSYEHLTSADAAKTAYERADAMIAQRG